MNVTLVVDKLLLGWRRASDLLVELLLGTMALLMVVKGAGLVEATWSNTISDFPVLSVGVTYMPIPLGGLFTLLFIVEKLWLGTPPPSSIMYRDQPLAE